MGKTSIVVLESCPKRAAQLETLLRDSGQYDIVLSDSPRQLMDAIEGRDDIKLVITNTKISRDEKDGGKFIKALYLKYQRDKMALPPIIVCSAEQRGEIVRLYAYRFSELALVHYVLLRDDEIATAGDKLLDAMRRSIDKRKTLDNSTSDEAQNHQAIKGRLKETLKQIVHLPALSNMVAHMRDVLSDPKVSFEELSKIINLDMTLAANLIKLANSPAYGASGKIMTAEDACKKLGLKSVTNTLLATKALESLGTLPMDFDMESLRRHSYAVGSIARLVARRCHAYGNVQDRIDFSSAMFSAGLLHDIGKALLAQHFVMEVDEIVSRMHSNDSSMTQAETAVLGFDHADAGLHASMEWQFPILLINVIGRHHWPLEKILPRLKTKQGRLAQRVIRIADAASYELGYGMVRSDGKAPPLHDDYFEKTGIDRSEFDKWCPEMRNDISYTLETMGSA